jgi:hypothetical protein
MWATITGVSILAAISVGVLVWCLLDVRQADRQDLEALNLEYSELLRKEGQDQ